MSTSNNVAISTALRKIAAELRLKATKVQQQRAVKCAQILTAAQGLDQLRDILKGVR